MSAYVVSIVESLDRAKVALYSAIAAASISQYGGRYLARTNQIEALEGIAPRFIVIVEFPTMERAREWYASPEYARALGMRQGALERTMLIVDGRVMSPHAMTPS